MERRATRIADSLKETLMLNPMTMFLNMQLAAFRATMQQCDRATRHWSRAVEAHLHVLGADTGDRDTGDAEGGGPPPQR
jgi:hypothetical protein